MVSLVFVSFIQISLIFFSSLCLLISFLCAFLTSLYFYSLSFFTSSSSSSSSFFFIFLFSLLTFLSVSFNAVSLKNNHFSSIVLNKFRTRSRLTLFLKKNCCECCFFSVPISSSSCGCFCCRRAILISCLFFFFSSMPLLCPLNSRFYFVASVVSLRVFDRFVCIMYLKLQQFIAFLCIVFFYCAYINPYCIMYMLICRRLSVFVITLFGMLVYHAC